MQKETWDHLTKEELKIYHDFYNEYLIALIRKAQKSTTQELKDEIDRMENRQKELSIELKKRNY